MAHSLSEQCTPLKHEYDACFNAWFASYLEPAVQASTTPESRTEHATQKAAEFEAKCGKIWKAYRECVQSAVRERGLEPLLRQARDENPLKESPP